MEPAATAERTDWSPWGLSITLTTAGTQQAGTEGTHRQSSMTCQTPSPHLLLPALFQYMRCVGQILKMETEPRRRTNLGFRYAPRHHWRGEEGVLRYQSFQQLLRLTYIYVMLLWGKLPVHSLMVKCPCLQQLWPCAIPQSWAWTLFKIQWIVTQNTLEMLLLVFCSKGCHLNTSPNEPRPDTCQLHEGFSAAMHNVPGIIFPTSRFVVEGAGSSLCTLPVSSSANSPHLLHSNAHCGLQLRTSPSWPHFLPHITLESLCLPSLCLWQVSTFLPSLLHQPKSSYLQNFAWHSF